MVTIVFFIDVRCVFFLYLCFLSSFLYNLDSMGKQNTSKHEPHNFANILRQHLNSLSEEDSYCLSDRIGQQYHIDELEWRLIHPQALSCASDGYYVKLVNRLIDRLAVLRIPNPPADLIKVMALSVAAYLEDLVNDFGVWNAFRNLYSDLYGSMLPFYNCDHEEYLTDNVNPEDVKFIVWQSFVRCGQPDERFFSPYSEGISKMADILYDEIVDEYEMAPESTRIADFISSTILSDDYIEVRKLAYWLSVSNPLIAAPWMNEYVKLQCKILVEEIPDKQRSIMCYHVMCSYSWPSAVGPLGIPVTDYLAQMCRDRGFDNQADIIGGINVNSFGLYKIISRSEKHLVLTDYTGTEYKVQRNSLANSSATNNITKCAIQLIRFNGEWNVNGMMTALPDNADISESQPQGRNDMPESVKEYIRNKIDEHGGQRVFVFQSIAQVNEFMQAGGGDRSLSAVADEETELHDVALLLSLEQTPLIINGGAAYFKIKGNSKFSKAKSRESGLELIADGLPDDVARYIQDNHLAPEVQIFAAQGSEVGRAIVQDNFRFLAGFYRSKVFACRDED